MTWLKFTTMFIGISLCTASQSALAVWFEATGQAVVHNGEKSIARQQATQEAIKQALLFAGASVKSVQHMANGLLQDDKFEVRTSGEVASVELIDEIFSGDIVTVSVRADIFAQNAMCEASDYKKDIVTTWYQINKRQQAAVGNMYDFGKVLANKLLLESRKFAKYSTITQLEPYYFVAEQNQQQSSAFKLAKKTNAQFVLLGEITEFGIETKKQAGFKFWKEDQVNRNLALAVTLYDGNSGDLVFAKQLNLSAPWEFNLHQDINSQSQALWQSSFGQATQQLIQDLTHEIDEAVSCLPAYGRVMSVNGEQLTINIGQHNGVQPGDQLTLFQVNQIFDDNKKAFKQFQLHPEKVVVQQVFAKNAVVVSENGVPLANIQPNDFVARR